MKKTFVNILVFFYSFITIFGLIPLLNNYQNSLIATDATTVNNLEKEGQNQKQVFNPFLFTATDITQTTVKISWLLKANNQSVYFIDEMAISTTPNDPSNDDTLSLWKDSDVYYSHGENVKLSDSSTIEHLIPGKSYNFFLEIIGRSVEDNSLYSYLVSEVPITFTTLPGTQNIDFEVSILENSTDVTVKWTTSYIKINSIKIQSLNDSNIFYENSDDNNKVNTSGSIILKGFKPNSTDKLKIQMLYYDELDSENINLKTEVEIIELTFPQIRTGVQTFFMYLGIIISILIILLLIIFLTLFLFKKFNKENLINNNYYEKTPSFDNFQNYSQYSDNNLIEGNYDDDQNLNYSNDEQNFNYDDNQNNNYFSDEQNLDYLENEIIDHDEYKENY